MTPNSLVAAASFSARSLRPPNAWVGHLPFAAWVVRQVAPRILVELGTHSGNSYFSFCQAIAEAGLPTRAFAVDTWQGDEHAGRYDESVWEEVNAHNQECYAGFSRLLRMTFDDAAGYFSDGSIDLLHIDGLHTYEAVRHDFETWLPRLAPGAVVMFHDTNVRERGFGVWKLWEELRSHYPNHLEFVHSHGLGVLQLNRAAPASRQKWLHSGEAEKLELRGYFAALGSSQLQRFALAECDELRRQAAELPAREARIDELKQHAANLALTVDARDARIAELSQHAANLTLTVDARDARIAELSQHAANLALTVDARDARIAELSLHAKNLGQEVATRDAHLADLRQLAADLGQELSARDERIASLGRDAAAEREASRRGLEERDARIAELERAAGVSELEAAAARDRARGQELEITRQASEIARQASEIAGLGERVRDLDANLQGRITTIQDLRASTSWRITYPMRALKRLFARLVP